MISSWDESMETGDPDIDRQHRELLDLVDELASAEIELHSSSEYMFGILARVMDFTTAHFSMEENLMRRVKYPAELATTMLDAHIAFVEGARARVLEFREHKTASVLPLHDFLKDWLVNHEFGIDRELVNWIRAHS